jgi:hypothetical protein
MTSPEDQLARKKLDHSDPGQMLVHHNAPQTYKGLPVAQGRINANIKTQAVMTSPFINRFVCPARILISGKNMSCSFILFAKIMLCF